LIEGMAKDTFIIYKSFYEPIEHLTDEQLGRLFRAIFKYQTGNADNSIGKDIEMAYLFFVSKFKEDEDKYQRIIDIRRECGSRGGRPRKEESGAESEPAESSAAQREAEESFAEFWEAYHNITHLHKTDREAAFKHWKRLTKKERKLAIERIGDYFASVNDPRYCKKARTYLADKNFNDEYKQARTSFPVAR